MLRSSHFVCFSASVLLILILRPPATAQPVYQDQTLEVHDLPTLVARTQDASDVLLTSLDTILHNKSICCGRDSALEDGAQRADPKSLKDAADRLKGRHLLSDGRPILVTADFLPPDSVSSGVLVGAMLQHQPAIMLWNSHIYVVHGIVFVWTEQAGPEGGTASTASVIRKILLWDTRYSDARREVVYDREKEDASKVQGLLFVKWAPQ